jgi:2'-5' RNA ligase
MRLFVAIELDEAARKAIAAEQRRLRAAAPDALRWVRPEQMHLTLVFLGKVDEPGLERVSAALGASVPHRPFDLAFGGAGLFPPRGAPRVLWIGAREGAADAIDVQRTVAERLTRAGQPLEPRPFRPHLTLGRWTARSSKGRSADARRLIAASESGSVARVRVERVALFRSQLSPAGATHTVLAYTDLLEPTVE